MSMRKISVLLELFQQMRSRRTGTIARHLVRQECPTYSLVGRTFFLTALAIVGLASTAFGQRVRCPTIVDGHIQLNGTITQIAGIEAQSPDGRLSLDFIDVPGVGRVDLKHPFPGTAFVVDNKPTSVVIGVLGAENRIDIEGETITAIGYDGDNQIARSDLTVNLGLGDAPPLAGVCIPEPASGWMAAIGFVGLLHLSRWRQHTAVA